MGENRNFLLAAVIAIGILLLYQVFVLDPMARDREAAEAARVASQAETTNPDDAPQAEPSAFAPGSARMDHRPFSNIWKKHLPAIAIWNVRLLKAQGARIQGSMPLA